MTMDDGADKTACGPRMSRRTILTGVAGSAMAAILAACGGAAATDTPKPPPPRRADERSGATTTAPTAATTGPAPAAPAARRWRRGDERRRDAATRGGERGGGQEGRHDQGGDQLGCPESRSALLQPPRGSANPLQHLRFAPRDGQGLEDHPSLAESWQQPDPKTYIFKLRQGVKFHDGTDFNADAVKFNIERSLTDKKSSRVAEIGFIQTVEVMDPYTVKFNLKAPFAPLLANLVDRAGMMLSPKAIQAGGEDFTRKPVGAGTGAFKFVEWVKDDHITLERNPNYWKKDAAGNQLPYLDKVTIRPIVDATVALTNLKTGDIDISHYVAAKDFDERQGRARNSCSSRRRGLGTRASSSTAGGAIQQEGTAPGIRGGARPRPDPQDRLLRCRSGRLRALPAAKFRLRPELQTVYRERREGEGVPESGRQAGWLHVRVQDPPAIPQTTQLAQLIKDQVAKVGITMNLVQLDFPTLVADTNAGKYQASLAGWSGRIDPDGNTYNKWHTGTPNNLYSNPQVDDLLDKARASSDQAQRKDLYQQAQKIAVDDAPFVYYEFPLTVMLTRPNVQGMQVYADGIMRFEVGWLK